MNKLFKDVDLIHGNITNALLLFATPILISNLFQQFYNTIDTTVVGHFLGDTSLSAIGSCTAIYDLLVGFALGIGNGLAIVTARSFGSGNEKELKKSVACSIIIGIISSILISIISYFGMHPLLKVLRTPESIIDEAYSYIIIITLFVIVMFAYNLCAGLLRAIGNSIMPLLFLIISSILNIFLDLLFIVVLHFGIEGTAIATVLAQGISVVFCIIYIYKRGQILIPNKEHFEIDKELYKESLGQGLSMGFMSSIVSCGTVILQFGINGLGKTIIAAHTVARKLFVLIHIPLGSLALAIATFVSQNKGADNRDRIMEGMKISYVLTIIITIICTLVVFIFGRSLVKLVSGSSNEIILYNATLYLKINIPFFVVLGVLLCARNALQGLGEKVIPLVSSGIELLGKIIFVVIFIPMFAYRAIIWCEPIIWIAMTIQLLYALYTNKYIRGKR